MEQLELTQVLQELYDSEINVTLTSLWDGGFNYSFVSYMDFGDSIPWDTVETAEELPWALHEAAMQLFPTSKYAIEHA